MRQVRIICIIIEITMLLSVILMALFTDFSDSQSFLYRVLLILYSLNAVVFHNEQKNLQKEIEIEENERYL